MYGEIGNRPDAALHPIMNGDTTCIPDRGLVQSTGIYIGTSQSDGKGSAIVRRPTVHSHGDLLVNRNPCNPGDRGAAHSVFPTVVAYQADDPLSRDPLPGEIWGPKTGSWFIHRGYGGFRILGGAGLGFVNVMRHIPLPTRRFILETTLSPCGSATATEIRYSFLEQDWCDLGETFTVWDSISIVQTDLDPGTYGRAAYNVDSDRWEVYAVGGEGCCFGGSGSGSGSGSGASSSCVTTIGGVDFKKLPGFESGVRQYFTHDEDDCFRWITPGRCGSGSGS